MAMSTPTRAAATAAHVATTYAQQHALRALPVPALKHTLHKYERTLIPLLSPQAFRGSHAILHSAENLSRLEALHGQLQQRASTSRNWLEEWWDSDQYLRPRDSLPINYNYFLRFRDEAAAAAMPVVSLVAGVAPPAQVSRAARLLRAMAEFCLALSNERVSPDLERGQALDMNQYARLFGYARVPEPTLDRIECHGPQPASLAAPHYATEYVATEYSRHVAVIAKGRYYRVDILAEDGSALPAQQLAHSLSRVLLAAAQEGEAPHALGALTALRRDSWAAVRADLTRSFPATTACTLASIDSALWVVCLDDYGHVDGGSVPPPHAKWLGPGGAEARSSTRTVSARLSSDSPMFLHGRGDGGDRFFDKHQLIVLADGSAGILSEHAAGDGMTVMRLMNYMLAASWPDGGQGPPGGAEALGGVEPPPPSALRVDMDAVAHELPNPVRHGGGVHLSRLPRSLPVDLTPSAAMAVSGATAFMRSLTSALSTRVLHFGEWGAAEIKRMRLPPDAFAQMAMQVAHQRLYGGPCATYESTHTRAFAQGRTEVTRSASVESLALATAMAQRPAYYSVTSGSAGGWDSTALRRSRAALLVDACEAHTRYAREAKAGMGVDRHLHGLITLARAEEGADLPPMFLDPAYALSRHWRLSTSNCGSECTSLFGYGPVVDDGFGAAYFITNETITFNLTAWTGRASLLPADPAAFADALETALRDLQRVGEDHRLLVAPAAPGREAA